ncbi:hypothetical protein GUJ93_ZPchr0001g31212 [Zizania palustris]|uniref:Uncharacterized protein n=1 Tax=Zizania palustris TaxID=103762 RepID=A0A8J5SC87_ZIZPA|nr:hypothetical protein GUJ93_ZPchr0001g31212 [Zizania palustris]
MAEQRSSGQAPEVHGKVNDAAADTGEAGGGAWLRGKGYQNPPEPGWLEGPRWPNPPDPANPDPATLREQWLFATRRFSRWYSRAWGGAILAGAAVFAVGWAVKGSCPIPPRRHGDGDEPQLLDAAGQKP